MTRFDPAYTAQFYDVCGSREWTRWESSPRNRVQHAIMCHHLRERIATGDRVLDAGCGPGVFARELLALGARVTCLDLSSVQLQSCRERAPECEAYELGSVTDLARFGDRTFDVTLAMGGVLSYCFERAPQALAELVRVTRPGGWLGLSVMSLHGTLHSFLSGVIAIAVEDNRKVLATGNLDRAINDGHECHLFRPDELRSLLEVGGLREIELHANGWLVPNGGVGIPEGDPAVSQFLLEAELEASRDCPGAGTHIIAWGRVPR